MQMIYGVNSAFKTFQKQLLVTKKIIFLRSCTMQHGQPQTCLTSGITSLKTAQL